MSQLNLSLTVSAHTKRRIEDAHPGEPPAKDQKTTAYFSQTAQPAGSSDHMDEEDPNPGSAPVNVSLFSSAAEAANASPAKDKLEQLQDLIDSFAYNMNDEEKNRTYNAIKNILTKLDAEDLLANTQALRLIGRSGHYAGFTVLLIFLLGNHSADDVALVKAWCQKKIITSDDLAFTMTQGRLNSCSILFAIAVGSPHYLQILIDEDLLSVDMLGAVDQGGDNTIWVLAYRKEFGILQKLLDKNLLSADMLEAKNNKGINPISLIAHHKKFGLLLNLLDKDLISIKSFKLANKKGLNAVWYIAALKRWKLLQNLLDKGLLSTDLLNQKNRKGKNALWFIIHNKKWGLLRGLLDKNLLSTDLLDRKNAEGENAILSLAYDDQWELLEKILDNGLLTKEALEATDCFDGNAALFMIHEGPEGLLQKLLDKGLLTKDALDRIDSGGGNGVLGIAYQEQWGLLQKLLDHGLLTKDALEAKNTDGENAVLILAYYEQWGLLQKLLDSGLISVNALGATDSRGDGEENSQGDGANTVLLIARNEQWQLLQNLLDQNLLTAALLTTPTALTPNGATTYPVPGLGLILATAKKWELLETLFTKKLLDMTDLTRSWTDRHTGKSAIELIARQNLPLLKKFITSGESALMNSLEQRPQQQNKFFTTLFKKLYSTHDLQAKENILSSINDVLFRTNTMGEEVLLLLDKALKTLILTKENGPMRGAPWEETFPYLAEEKRFMNLIVDKYIQWTGAPLHSEQGKFLALCYGPAGYPRALSVVLQHQAIRQLDHYLPRDLRDIIESYVD